MLYFTNKKEHVRSSIKYFSEAALVQLHLQFQSQLSHVSFKERQRTVKNMILSSYKNRKNRQFDSVLERINYENCTTKDDL